jgi:hypothetical protein
MVFCSLTNLLVSRRGDAVQKHLGGKRFARAQGEFCRRPLGVAPPSPPSPGRCRMITLTIFRN